MFWVVLVNLNRNLLDLLESKSSGFPECPDDDPGVNSLLNKGLALLQELPGKDDDTGGAISHLGVLLLGNVDQSLGCWVNNVQQLHDGGTIIADCCLAPGVYNQLVHASGAQSRSHSVDNGAACVDVGDHLIGQELSYDYRGGGEEEEDNKPAVFPARTLCHP